MKTTKKQLNVSVDKIYLFQLEGEVDILYFMLEAPSPDPRYPHMPPVMAMEAAEGYGAQWLQEVCGLQPDETFEG